MPVLLGGPKARSTRLMRGGIVVSMQYVNNEPAMVLFPFRKRAQQAGYIICLSAAWKYADDIYLSRAAYKAAEVMGLGTESFTVYNVARAINDNLEDLVKMKPEPEETPQVIGEGTIQGASDKPIDFVLTDKMLH